MANTTRFKGGYDSEVLSIEDIKSRDMIQSRHDVRLESDADKGIPFELVQATPVCVCTSAAGTTTKTAAMQESFADFTLINGRQIICYMVNGNTASNPMLNVAGTGAIPLEKAQWSAGSFLRLKYVDITLHGNRIQRWLVESADVFYATSGSGVNYSGVNLNNIVESGVYAVNTDNAARDNFPSGTNGVLYVFSYIIGATHYVRQLFFRIGTINSNDYNIFTRQIRADGTIIGDWLRMITEHETGYELGETVTLNFNVHAVLNGIISSSATKVIVDIELPKELPTTKVINMTSIYGSLRGIAGYLDSVNYERELTNEYAVTIQKTIGKNATIVFTKSSAFTNTTNNTITSACLDRLSFTIPNS